MKLRITIASLVFLILIQSIIVYSQQRHRVTNLSKKFDLVIDVESKDEQGRVRGEFSLFRKGAKKPFQIIRHHETDSSLNNANPTFVSVAEKQNGKWSPVYLEDFNFDRLEDLAIADGYNGGYRGVSYRIYRYSSGRFVYCPSLTRLSQGPYIGIPGTDRKQKTLDVFWKSGAGFRQTERYKIVKNRPRKVYEYSEDSMVGNGNVFITTKKWINGRWRTWSKTIKDTN